MVLCTHRRPVLTGKALESLARQNLAASAFEVVVVDNASGDETPQVVAASAARMTPDVRYVHEATLGLAAARNTGINESRADLVAFLDDDAVADPGWLAGLVAGFDQVPAASAVGGPVAPLWETPRPRWLADHLLTSLSVVDWGPTPRALVWPERLIGANIAFRRAFFDGARFHPDLGRKGDQLLGFEDTEVQEQIHQGGGVVHYTPDARVEHRVPPERATLRYFVRRSHGTGRSEVMLRGSRGEDPGKVLLATLARVPKRLVAIRGVWRPHGFAQYLMSQAHTAGLLRESTVRLVRRAFDRQER